MTPALIVAVLIAVGLPLFAWWVGGLPFWRRLRPGAEGDAWADAMKARGLTYAEASEVESAVLWGKTVEDERLRPVVVDVARERIERRREARRSRRGRLKIATAVLVVSLMLAHLVALTGRFPWSFVFLVLTPIPFQVWLARGPRRALRRNSGVSGVVEP